MDGTMNDNQLTIVKEHELDKPFLQKIDSIIDNCYRDCHKNIFIHLNIKLNMILNLQISLIMK